MALTTMMLAFLI